MKFHIPESELTKRSQKEFAEGYRKNRFDHAIKYVKNFRTAVDIGAHIGSWTVLMAERFNNVIAIEPNPSNIIHLKHNIELNDFSNITVLPYAAHDRIETLKMSEPKKPISAQINKNGDVEVNTITLDSCNLDNVDFLKIHCNGHEEYALRGCISTIVRCKPIIFITVKVNQYVQHDNTTAILNIMGQLGYKKIWHVKPDYVFRLEEDV